MKQLIRCGGVLLAITLIMGALLGYVNSVTSPVIDKLSEKNRLESIKTVLEGTITGEEVKHEVSGESTVSEIVEYQTDKGRAFAVTAAPKGYGGSISMMIGLNENAVVTGVSIMDMSETAGLGARAKNPEFLEQFNGENPKIDALTGATITTNAVKTGVNDAIEQVRIITEGAVNK